MKRKAVLAIYTFHETEDVGGAEHIGDDEDHQEQHDDAHDTGASRSLRQLLVELREFGAGQV